MKTKELIEQLQKADPSGELDVVCGRYAIYYVDRLPGYYDGMFERLIPSDNHPWPKAAQVVGDGFKVKLVTFAIEDLLFEDPETPVEVIGGGSFSNPEAVKWVAKTREEARKLRDEVEAKRNE